MPPKAVTAAVRTAAMSGKGSPKARKTAAIVVSMSSTKLHFIELLVF